MSWNRYAKRTDTTQAEILLAVRRAGWEAWSIGLPCDLLCWKESRGFHCLEVKTPRGKKQPKARIDKRQEEQMEFLELTGTPVVCTPMEALLALGEKVDLLP
jgi:hypothetical protein